jgi:hypothetical protein
MELLPQKLLRDTAKNSASGNQTKMMQAMVSEVLITASS